jgi:hypothetical protein
LVEHAAGVIVFKLFNSASSTTPTETVRTSGRSRIGSATDHVVFGAVTGSRTSALLWSDDFAIGWSRYLGPA